MQFCSICPWPHGLSPVWDTELGGDQNWSPEATRCGQEAWGSRGGTLPWGLRGAAAGGAQLGARPQPAAREILLHGVPD